MLEEFVGKQVVLTMISANGSQSELHSHKVVGIEGNLIKLDNSIVINTNSLYFVKIELAPAWEIKE